MGNARSCNATEAWRKDQVSCQGDQCAQHIERALEAVAGFGRSVVGADKNKGGRCLVPASAFAEPDQNTTKPVINRWFGRADGLPFFFAGVWREWQGDRGTIKAPNVGLHRVFAFLTTEPNGAVEPIHDKAMPVMLMSAQDVEAWLTGTLEEALKLQKPQPDHAIVITPFDEKKAA
jgi:putative SOS response-associated peptidase YedK